MLDILYSFCHNGITTKVDNQKTKQDTLCRNGSKMNTLTVGSQFTTAKSGVVGTIQEIVKNQNGTSRVRLSVDGSDRWTTVK